ncbi:UDP-N-acetylmuramate--L-alanine ligase [Wolbachia endosymbiont of Pentidionis agamae]|uniref:UDP-N-acetylmuramate--L-alanine ligase n=1 Tax=Wolbachia endosymbiont of Pentidionis agamae TaxID=3110435 RepID=UPI002FCFEE65
MDSNKIIHIIGIGGIGMSAIAEILNNLGYRVQGSDSYLSANVDRLQKNGIKVYVGHNSGNINEAHTVIYSSAIKYDNVELVAARNNNKIILHRSNILADLTKGKYVIAVSGSSGKTTTTAKISSILDYSEINASVIIGGVLNASRSNAKFGKSNIFLIEADESDGTMLKIQSDIAVITSINDDHIDYYGTSNNIRNAFSKFVNQASYAILPDLACIVHNNSITFGFNESAGVRAVNVKQRSNSMEFDVLYVASGREDAQASPQVLVLKSMENLVLSNAIGLHKVSNALAAISVAIKLGLSEENIRNGLLNFKGVERRFCTIAEINGIKLIEDYAHHPDEILATLTAARSITEGKIIGIIEPLRFSRVRSFFSEFIKVFTMFDYVILTPIHPPGDKAIPGYNIDDIKQALAKKGFINVKIINDFLLISHFISHFACSGDIALFIGAGTNIAKLAKETVNYLHRQK